MRSRQNHRIASEVSVTMFKVMSILFSYVDDPNALIRIELGVGQDAGNDVEIFCR